MAEYDKKDRSDLSKGAAACITTTMAQRLGPGSRFDNALLQRSSLGRCHIADWRVKPEAVRNEQSSRAPRLYHHLTNVLGLAAVADHLELHAKSLPDPKTILHEIARSRRSGARFEELTSVCYKQR